jgi:uncharacterized protein YjbI with pentapeptide repeats
VQVTSFVKATTLAVVALAPMIAPPVLAAAGPATPTRSGGALAAATIISALRRGQPLILSGVVVHRRLDLTRVGTVRQPFKCRACTFERGIDASDVIFDRTLDLSGSTVHGGANFAGTTFQGPALFTNTPRPAEFDGKVNFRLADFNDLAAFDHASFERPARFSLARFRSQASFALTTFAGVTFYGATLAGGAIFDGAEFEAQANFGRAAFGESDFRSTIFSRSPSFTDVVFRGHADFSGAEFEHGGVFDDAQLPMGASFVGATFTAVHRPRLAGSFDGVAASSTLDFTFVRFVVEGRKPRGKASPPAVSMSELVSGGTVSFSGAEFPDGYSIVTNRIAAKNLVFDVEDAARVKDEKDERRKPHQRHLLELIESSAKTRGDLVTANNAEYRLRELASRHYWGPYRVLDAIFYRGIAGYFVRPLHPLVTLVAVALVFAAVRLFLGREKELQRPASRRRSRFVPSRRDGRRISRLLSEFLDALGRVLPWRTSSEGKPPTLGHRLEAVLYRVLLACALIGLANSNPTLRRLVDSIL